MPVTPISFSQLHNHKTENATAFACLIKPESITLTQQEKAHALLSAMQSTAAEWNGKSLQITAVKPTGKGTVIAILDTGVFGEHPDLKGKVMHAINAELTLPDKNLNPDIHDEYGHGTHVAGIIAASESRYFPGFRGIAPDAKIVSVKVTRGDGSSTSWVNIARGLELVLKYNEKVESPALKVTCVLICFSGYDNFNAKEAKRMENHHLINLFRQFYNADIPVIVPAGNHYYDFCKKDMHGVRFTLTETEGLAYPAYNKYVLSAGASSNIDFTDPDLSNRSIINIPQRVELPPRMSFDQSFRIGDIGVYSQRIRQNVITDDNVLGKTHFIIAPGLYTISTDNKMPVELHAMSDRRDGDMPVGYSMLSGSCQAAAVVAGTVLLLQEKLSASNPGNASATMEQLIRALKENADKVDFDQWGRKKGTTSDNKLFYKLNIRNTVS